MIKYCYEYFGSHHHSHTSINIDNECKDNHFQINVIFQFITFIMYKTKWGCLRIAVTPFRAV